MNASVDESAVQSETPVSGGRHTPGPVRPVTAIEWAANAAERWRAQYRDWHDTNRFSNGTTKGEVDDALDRSQHTPADIAHILNEDWAYPDCDCCGKRWPVVASFTHPWREAVFSICLPCLAHGESILRQFPEARVAILQATGAKDE